jgi:hypothetical protein
MTTSERKRRVRRKRKRHGTTHSTTKNNVITKSGYIFVFYRPSLSAILINWWKKYQILALSSSVREGSNQTSRIYVKYCCCLAVES